ncbi:SMC-Scp complex subunit ScpB [Mesorhizobium sp. M0293]|uniref:SMC-Scp complex subunit ScpB n=1 Tax=Mesorhizobium sp. M0293 TaxID=2956930 RepID=UPI00333675BD
MVEAAGTTTGKRKDGARDGRRPGDRRSDDHLFDRELDHLPAVGRVEAVIFAAGAPVTRETLAKIIGKGCNLDLIIDDIREELRGRPYELVSVVGGWQHRTRPAFADAIRTVSGASEQSIDLSQPEALVLMTIAYFQPITRAELSSFFGREISDLIGNLRGSGFIATGPRCPTPGAPYTYVTTKGFLSHFGFETLRDLPDLEKQEDAGLLDKGRLLADITGALGTVGGGSEFLDDEGSVHSED